MRSPLAPVATGRRRRERLGRALEVGISLYGALVFGVLWLGVVAGVATGGAILADAWGWLTGLDPVAEVVAWLLILSIAVGLWAIESDQGPVVGALVAVGLVVWTAVAASGLVRTFRTR